MAKKSVSAHKFQTATQVFERFMPRYAKVMLGRQPGIVAESASQVGQRLAGEFREALLRNAERARQ